MSESSHLHGRPCRFGLFFLQSAVFIFTRFAFLPPLALTEIKYFEYKVLGTLQGFELHGLDTVILLEALWGIT